MSAGEERGGRPPEEAAEDQSTNELGFRDVDEEGDYDEAGGGQGAEPSEPTEREGGAP
jgi:hypothetical protein